VSVEVTLVKVAAVTIARQKGVPQKGVLILIGNLLPTAVDHSLKKTWSARQIASPKKRDLRQVSDPRALRAPCRTRGLPKPRLQAVS
jgi:hypothetical protein